MEDLEKKIMGEIASGRVTLRSKYLFLVEKLGLGSAMILTILLGSLLVSLILWYMKDAETLSYLSFGSDGMLAFWESFPYGLIVSAVIMIVLVGYILKKSGWVYQIPFGLMALSAIAGVMVIGVALAFTSLPEYIGKQESGPTRMFFRPVLPAPKPGKGGMVGKIVEWENPRGVIMTPHGPRFINAEHAPEPEREKVIVGVVVMVVGRPHEEIFLVKHIRVIPKDRLPQRMVQ